MSTILLQLESALADARSLQEQAAERLHDTGVAHALAKSQYDAATDAVKRVENALNSMHGVPVISQSRPTGSGLADEPKAPKAPKKPKLEGPACPSCGEVGRLTTVMRGSMKFAQCGACNAEIQAA